MKNYKDSDYALNKYSAGIVYHFADGIEEITLKAYLLENPDKTEQDFQILKALSDEIYHNQAKEINRQTCKNVLIDGLSEAAFPCIEAAETIFIRQIEEQEAEKRKKELLKKAKVCLRKLTNVQRRRYLMHCVDAFTIREIAEKEGVSHVAVLDSILQAKKKINFLLGEEKPYQNAKKAAMVRR